MIYALLEELPAIQARESLRAVEEHMVGGGLLTKAAGRSRIRTWQLLASADVGSDHQEATPESLAAVGIRVRTSDG